MFYIHFICAGADCPNGFIFSLKKKTQKKQMSVNEDLQKGFSNWCRNVSEGFGEKQK